MLAYLTRLAAAGSTADLAGRLSVGRSSVPGAGRGLFLAPGCSVPAGAVLTLYPGLVYDQEQLFREMAAASPGDDDAFAPAPPAFSMDNHYLLHLRACLGRHLLVDGRPTGPSAARFAAAARGVGVAVNAAWLEGERWGGPAGGCPGQRTSGGVAADAASSSGIGASSSGSSTGGSGGSSSTGASGSKIACEQQGPEPLLLQAAAGHLINHQPPGKANATFDLCPLPASLPPTLLRFVPALNAGGGDPGLRWVPLVRALHPLAAPEPNGSAASCQGVELFVDYGTDPSSLGFHY